MLSLYQDAGLTSLSKSKTCMRIEQIFRELNRARKILSNEEYFHYLIYEISREINRDFYANDTESQVKVFIDKLIYQDFKDQLVEKNPDVIYNEFISIIF